MPHPRSLPCLLVLGLLVLSCRAPSVRKTAPLPGAAPAFPIGIFSVPSTNDFPRLKAVGFNTIVGPADKSCLDAAQAAGLRVLVQPGTQAGPTFDQAILEKRVRSLDRHPAVWAWYLCDEPDLNLISPGDVSLAQRALRAAGARKPGAIALCQGSQALDYAAGTDVLLIDRYPIPWLPLASFGQHVRQARLAAGEEKTLIAIVQAFDWTSFSNLLSVPGPFRPPTEAEMRCMTYDALARGADGIFYYEFDGQWKIRDHPEVWNALQAVVGEVSLRAPLFQGRRLWWPRQYEFVAPRPGFNAALESSVTATFLEVTTGNAAVPPGCYMVTVNNTDQSLVYRWMLPPPATSAKARVVFPPVVEVLGENRAVLVNRRWITDTFSPLAVHVYGPLP